MPKISSLFNLQGLRLQREGHTRSMPNQTSSPRRYSMLRGRGSLLLTDELRQGCLKSWIKDLILTVWAECHTFISQYWSPWCSLEYDIRGPVGSTNPSYPSLFYFLFLSFKVAWKRHCTAELRITVTSWAEERVIHSVVNLDHLWFYILGACKEL